MTTEPDLATIGMLLGDRVRAAILETLLDGEESPASSLAESSGASPSLASAHLRRLLDGGLVRVRTDGRRRMYRLASPQVAEFLEAGLLLTPASGPVTSLRQATRRDQLRRARLCYDHLAGVLGVAVTDRLVAVNALTPADAGLAVTGAVGERALARLGIDADGLRAATRPLSRVCTDWTERRPHHAGGAGAAVASALLERRWVLRRPGQRGLDLTSDGATGLRHWIGLRVDALEGWRAA
jgi:DNA-binding transcriptional ArsR family regulator